MRGLANLIQKSINLDTVKVLNFFHFLLVLHSKYLIFVLLFLFISDIFYKIPIFTIVRTIQIKYNCYRTIEQMFLQKGMSI